MLAMRPTTGALEDAMKQPREKCTVDLKPIVNAIVEAITDRIGSASLREETFCHSRNNPLGSARAFLNAARRGDFPSFRAGRRVLARRSDVEAWILSRERCVRPVRRDDVELLRAAGAQVRR